MKQALIELIEKIPMLPETIQKIETVFQNPNAGAQDMVKAIQSDPLLIARILKLANSPLYGLSRSVEEISHAISLLGRDVIRTFAIAGAANDAMPLDLSAYGITPDEYLDRAQLQHTLAVGLAMKINRSALSHISLGSYLLELGRVVISRYLLDTNQSEAFAEALKSSDDYKALELEYCGAKSEDVTATIFNHWKFQPDLIYVIRHANEPEDASDEELQVAAKILKIAKESISLQGELNEETVQKGQSLMEEYGLDKQVFNEVIEKIRSAA